MAIPAMRHCGRGLATATRERGQLPCDSGARTRAIELAFLEPLPARRATSGATMSHARRLAKGESRRRSGQRRLLPCVWYLTGVISKRRTCGSSGFSDASERPRWSTKPAASRRRSRRRCTADGMRHVANFLASCAGAGITSHSRRRHPSLHFGMSMVWVISDDLGLRLYKRWTCRMRHR